MLSFQAEVCSSVSQLINLCIFILFAVCVCVCECMRVCVCRPYSLPFPNPTGRGRVCVGIVAPNTGIQSPRIVALGVYISS